MPTTPRKNGGSSVNRPESEKCRLRPAHVTGSNTGTFRDSSFLTSLRSRVHARSIWPRGCSTGGRGNDHDDHYDDNYSQPRFGQRAITGLALLPMVLATPALPITAAAGAPKKPRGRGRLAQAADRHLQEQLATVGDTTELPVIVTLRRGAKSDMKPALEAVVSPRKVTSRSSRAWPSASRHACWRTPEDSDVVSVSTDAPVTSTGLAVAVSGKAENSKYGSMSTLGLKSTPYSGKAIGVAVLDSGIAPLQDFESGSP